LVSTWVEVSALGAVSHAHVAADYGDRFASLFTKGAGYWRAIACRRSGSVCLDTILRHHLATTMMPNVRSGSFASVGRCSSTFPIRTYGGARNLLIEGAAEACHAITMMSNISPPNIQCILFQFNGSHAQVTRAMLLGSRASARATRIKGSPFGRLRSSLRDGKEIADCRKDVSGQGNRSRESYYKALTIGKRARKWLEIPHLGSCLNARKALSSQHCDCRSSSSIKHWGLPVSNTLTSPQLSGK